MSYPFRLRKSVKNGFGIILATLGIVFLLLSLYLPRRDPYTPDGSRNDYIGKVERQRQGAAGETQTRTSEPTVVGSDITAQSRLSETYGRLPLRFEANKGQTDSQVRFLSRGIGYDLFLTATGAVLNLGKTIPPPIGKDPVRKRRNSEPNKAELKYTSVRMKLLGGNLNPAIRGAKEMSSRSNYFIGDDPTKWRTGISNYAKVEYDGVYPGVNLVYYGNQRQLEYDFIVTPGADPTAIKISFEGSNGIRIDPEGDLIIQTPAGDIRQHKPLVYQEDDAGRKEIAARYVLGGEGEVGFAISDYDVGKTLVIDPVLVYSTYLGGTSDDTPSGIAVDETGSLYVAGRTSSTNFPVTPGAFQTQRSSNQQSGNVDIFVAKLNPAGTELIYSTYIGGSGNDSGMDIAVDGEGCAYVTGEVDSTNYPTTPGALQPQYNGSQNGLVTKLSPDGSALVYSTYLGGTHQDFGAGIAVDGAGCAFVAGGTFSGDFPIHNAFQPGISSLQDAFLTKLSPDGASLIYSTYYGGWSYDIFRTVTVDANGYAYAAGNGTSDFGLPLKNQVQSHLAGINDTYVVKFTPDGTDIVYSTYIGGSKNDIPYGIAADSLGNAYVTGETSSVNFPITVGALQVVKGAGDREDGYVVKIGAQGGPLVYSTYLGGSGADVGVGIAVDASGDAYLVGTTFSPDFPLVGELTPGVEGPNNLFVSKLNAAGSSLLFSVLLGQGATAGGWGRNIALEPSGSVNNIYVAGSIFSRTTQGHGFIAKLADQLAADIKIDQSAGPNPVTPNSPLTLTLTVTNNGPGTARDVKVTDDLPASTQFASCAATGGGVCGGTSNHRTIDFESIPAGASETVTLVVMVNDAVPDETVINNTAVVTSSASDPDADNNTAVATAIVSAPPSQLQFGAATYSVSEGAGSVTLSVTRTGGDGGAISVQYTTIDGTATSGFGNDYTVQGLTTLFWAAGDSFSKEITIPINNDMVFEGAEQFRVIISNPTGRASVVEPSEVAVTVIENDAAPVFGFQHLGQEEGNAVISNFGIFITKTGNTAVTATLDYQTVPGTATPGSSCDEPGVDYVITSGTLTFLPQETSKLLRIVVCGGAEPEPEETFSIPFVNPVNGIILPGTGTSNIWIANDDKFAPTVVASIASYTFDGTGHAAGGSATGNDGATLSPSVTISYSGTGATTYPASSTPPSAVGTYQVVANFAGNSNYTSGSSAPVPYTIYKATPLISWGAPIDITYGTALSDTQLNATANVPGTFTYTPAAGVVLNAGGDHPLSVSFTADDSSNYDPASASVTINVRKAAPVVNAVGGTYTYDGLPQPATGSVVGVGGQDLGAPTFTYNGSSTPPVDAGSYAIVASFAGNDNYEPASDSTAIVIINKAAAALALTGLTHSYDGTQKAASVTVTPPGLSSLTVTYDGSITPPTNAGSYAVMASLANQNFAAPDVTGTLVIDKAVTTASIASSLNPSVANQPVTFTVTVTGPGGPPAGSIEFFDGTTSLGSATLTGDGTASLTTSALPPGARSVTGAYIGGANFFGGATPVLMQVVAVLTPTGRNVSVTGSTETCTVQLTYSNVTAAGTTTITPIDPSGLTTPGDFTVDGSTLAFDISTTATFRGQVTICFQVPTVTDQATFNSLRILHYVNGKIVAEKITTRDWATKTICTVVNSLSPFAVIRTTDFTPPEIGLVSVDKQVLWPANHKMVDVTVSYSVTDNYTPADELVVALSVTSNEPENGTGDGNITPDWEVVDGHHVRLRAERAGVVNGRVYMITVTASDRVGNTTSRMVTVSVPKRQ